RRGGAGVGYGTRVSFGPGVQRGYGVVVGALLAVGHGVDVGVPGPVVTVAVRVGVVNIGLGVTVTARGVATLPGQQPATAAVAWASPWVGGGAQPATASGTINRMRSDTRFIACFYRRSALKVEYIRPGCFQCRYGCVHLSADLGRHFVGE